MRPFMRAIIKRMRDVIGDVSVYGIYTRQLAEWGRSDDLGFFNRGYNHIIIQDGMPPDVYIHTLIHEAVHALTVRSLDAATGFKDLTTRLMRHTMDQLIKSGLYNNDTELRKAFYGFKDLDPAEFIAEAMSSKYFQNVLEGVTLSPRWLKTLV